MSRIFTACLVAVALSVAVTGSPAHAQQTADAASEATPAEKVQFARAAKAEIDQAIKKGEKLLDSTTDPDAISCVKDNVDSLRTLQSVVSIAEGEMNKSLAANKAQMANHEFRKIAVSLSKARQFLSEAQTCSGEQGALDSTTDVKVQSDAIAEGDDTAPLIGQDALVGEVNPPPNSPFQ